MRLRKSPRRSPRINLSLTHSSGVISTLSIAVRLLRFKICKGDADICKSDLTCCASQAPVDGGVPSLPYREAVDFRRSALGLSLASLDTKVPLFCTVDRAWCA